MCTALLAGCAQEEEAKTYSLADAAAGFDTVYSYSETTTDEEAFQTHFTEGRDLFSSYNDMFDIYHEYSALNNLMTVNENAGKAPVTVSQEIMDMLLTAKEFYELTDGAFDITMGATMKIWHEYREEGITLNEEGKDGNLPSEEELAEARQYRGWEYIELDDENNTVYITDEHVSLDVGGIAKGYAAEHIAKMLEEEGVTSALVNAGRNLRTIGSKPNGKPWKVGIANPANLMDSDGIMILAFEGTGSFVTSGDYERYYTVDGKNYHHILDPKTDHPADLYHSVTIVCKDSTAADCLSTALFSLTVEEGKALLEKYEEKTGDHASAVWIMDEDKAQGTEGTTLSGLFITYSSDLEDTITWSAD